MVCVHVQRFVACLGRWERLSVRQLVHGVKTSRCGWLGGEGGGGQGGGGGRRCGGGGRSEGLKRTETMARLFVWLMSLVMDLVKVCVCVCVCLSVSVWVCV